MTDFVAAQEWWLGVARHSRSITPTHQVDQCDTAMRELCDQLGVDLHDPVQRAAMIAGTTVALSNLGSSDDTIRVACNVLGSLVAPWWADR